MVTTDWILSGAVVVGVLRDRSAWEGREGEFKKGKLILGSPFNVAMCMV